MHQMIERRRHERGTGFPPPEAVRFLELSPNGVLITDMAVPGAPLCYVNKAFTEITGYSRPEAMGRNCRFLQGDDRDQPEVARMREAIETGQTITVTVRNYRRDGRLFWNELQLTPLCDDDHHVTHYIGVMRDVSALRETSHRLRYAATIDRLTGVLNRYAFTDALNRMEVEDGRRTMVIKVDVIGFSTINTGYGYDAGDVVLSQIAARLGRVDAAAIGRPGSNEFSVAYRLDAADDGLSQLATLREALLPRFPLPGTSEAPISARFAIGFVIGEPGEDGATLLRRAGTALAQSKSSQLHLPREFDAKAARAAEKRLRMTSEILAGIGADEFLYHYQPKVDLATRRIIGAEALLRWRHKGKLRMPADFLAIAEDSDLLIDIGTQGFAKVAAFIGKLNRNRAEPLNVAVNVSMSVFDTPGIVDRARAILAHTGIDPRWMTFELTEGTMAVSSPELIALFREIRDLGLGLSIDDFGTGYSSLRYLEDFPISEIKIDQSFIRGMIAQPAKRFIVDAVIKLGWALGASVVAEGVETEDEAALLRELGCTTAQGYLFGKPMPPEEFMALVS